MSEKIQLSIHPRNWPEGNGIVSNTSKPPKPPCKKLDRKRARLNARRNDREATCARDSKLQMAFKVPGSMK